MYHLHVPLSDSLKNTKRRLVHDKINLISSKQSRNEERGRENEGNEVSGKFNIDINYDH